jgi:hypothetical protein
VSNDADKSVLVNSPVELFAPQVDQPPVELSPRPVTAPVTLDTDTEVPQDTNSTDVAVPEDVVTPTGDGMPGGRQPSKREVPSRA